MLSYSKPPINNIFFIRFSANSALPTAYCLHAWG